MASKEQKREVLYLKYRPQILSQVVGQEHIKKTLKGAIIQNRLSHAYLFAGPRGTGKTTVARILAKIVNCSKPQKGEPCNQCESCLEINQGKSLDVVEIDAASNRGIDEIRELRDKIRLTPSKGKYKVYIIDEVHMLTREAFNALLKTLEEPPAHALFILATTEIHKVPETIISRCQRFDFHRIKMSDLINYLKEIVKKEKLEIEEEALELIAANAAGALRDAINLLDQASSWGSKITLSNLQTILGLTDINNVFQLIDYITSQKISSAIELINNLLDKGYNLSSFNKKVIEHLRHMLILKETGEEGLLEVTAEQLEKIKKQVQRLEISQILTMIDIFLKAEKEFNLSPLPQLPLEIAVIEIGRMANGSFSPQAGLPKEEDKKINNQIKQTMTNEFKEFLKKWEAIIERTKVYNHSVSAFLKACQPKELKEDKIYLEFLYHFHCDKIAEPKNREIVEKVIEEVLGKDYKVECFFNPEGLKKDKKEDDDIFKTAVEIFKGEVIE